MNNFSIKSAKTDIHHFLNACERIQNGKIMSQNEIIILYSSGILLLYNFIEWSIETKLGELFSTYNNSKCIFKNINTTWKYLLIEDCEVSLLRKNKQKEKIKNIYLKFNIIEEFRALKFDNAHYPIKNVSKKYKNIFWINGNLNENEINKLCNKLWIQFEMTIDRMEKIYKEKFMKNNSDFEKQQFTLKNNQPLEFIKRLRNNLTHWASTFSKEPELQNYSLTEIEEISNCVLLYIEELINAIDHFISKKWWEIGRKALIRESLKKMFKKIKFNQKKYLKLV